jgi:MFS transporter, MHS family, shikimate and dehydroshikimate transport protein
MTQSALRHQSCSSCSAWRRGISFGAEFGTASTWVIEQAARSRHRAFWSAWVGFAIPIGLLLGFGSVILLKSLMAPESFVSWGWRILFLLGFLVAIVGIVIPTRTEDSFLFERHREQSTVLDHPAMQVWRDMPLTILRTSLVNAMFGGAFPTPPMSASCSPIRIR